MVSKSKSRSTPAESTLVLPRHADLAHDPTAELVDTHTHLLSTFSTYVQKYPDGNHATISDFVKAILLSEQSNSVRKIVDVWCEAPLVASPSWRDVLDELSAMDDFDYRFVIGVSSCISSGWSVLS
jgi:TatD DNase family protein